MTSEGEKYHIIFGTGGEVQNKVIPLCQCSFLDVNGKIEKPEGRTAEAQSLVRNVFCLWKICGIRSNFEMSS